MECRDVEALLQPYADGELDATESGAVESHLKFCPLCRDEVAAVRAWHDAIRQAARTAPSPFSPDLTERVRARLNETALEMERQNSPLQNFQKTSWRWWTAAAACLALAVGISAYAVGFSGRERREKASEQTFILYAKDSIARHVHQLPVEVAAGSQPQKVGRWFRGKVDFEPAVPSLNKKASLVGARLSNVRDRQAAYFLYDLPKADDGRASLFAFDAPDLEVPKGRKVDDCDVVLTNQQGYNVVIWKNDEIAYSLVADLSEQDILEMVSCEGEGEGAEKESNE